MQMCTLNVVPTLSERILGTGAATEAQQSATDSTSTVLSQYHSVKFTLCIHTRTHTQHQSCSHIDGGILPGKSDSVGLGCGVVPSGAQGELGMLGMLDCPSVWSELLGVSEIEQQFTVQ